MSGQVTNAMVADRAFVERKLGEPCSRFWLTRREFEAAEPGDLLAYESVDGHIVMWRTDRQVESLHRMAPLAAAQLERRRLCDMDLAARPKPTLLCCVPESPRTN